MSKEDLFSHVIRLWKSHLLNVKCFMQLLLNENEGGF